MAADPPGVAEAAAAEAAGSERPENDLLDIPPSEISDAKVTMTIFDGRTVH